MFNNYYLKFGLDLYLPKGEKVADQNVDFQSIYKKSSKSAFWGNADAYYILGVLHFIGADMPVNLEEAFRCFEKAMNKKHSTAAYNVFRCYLNGLGCKQDANNARAALMKAAELGSSSAYLTLGNYYYKSNAALNIAEDKQLALKYYKLGAEKYDAACKENYAIMLENGIGTTVNLREALKVYHDTASGFAKNKIGMWYCNGKEVAKDAKKAVYYFERAVEYGNADGMINLGYMYLWGVLPKDEDKIVNLWCDAALNGSKTNITELIESNINGDNIQPATFEKMVKVAEYYLKYGNNESVDQAWNLLMFANIHDCVSAVNLLGVYYNYFNNGVKDYKQAFDYYKEAADSGCVEAYANLGDYYMSSPFADKDVQKALQWYLKAAENGDAYSMNKLGCYYLSGQYVAQDMHQAFYWLKQAADKDYKPAFYNLARMYEHGDGTTKDINSALYYYNKGVEQNDAGCAYAAGCLYFHGEGVAKDYSKALQYFQISACYNGGAKAYYGIALCYCYGNKELRNFEKALVNCNNALQQDANFTPALKLKNDLTDNQDNLKPASDLKSIFGDVAGNVIGEVFGNVLSAVLTSGRDD